MAGDCRGRNLSAGDETNYLMDGFEHRQVEIGPTRYRPGMAGDGSPVLLLHGFP
jgi:hypothetical protein